jgi:hypothetical protein
MNNCRIRQASIDFFIAAALLALFGAASMNNAGVHGGLQLVLAVLMGGAGAFLRGGTAEARLVGLAAAGVTVAAGAYVLVVGNDYIVGTIIAVFAIFRLWSAGAPLLPQAAPAAAPLAGPMAAFDAPGPYGGHAFPAQPTAAPGQAPYHPVVAEPPYYPAPVQRPEDPA